MNKNLDNFENQPIEFQYEMPSLAFLEEAKKDSQAIQISANSRCFIENTHFKKGIPGSLPHVYIRSFLFKKIQQALSLLDPDFGFIIFDGYRDKKTQAGLFNTYFEEIKNKNPLWSQELSVAWIYNSMESVLKR